MDEEGELGWEFVRHFIKKNHGVIFFHFESITPWPNSVSARFGSLIITIFHCLELASFQSNSDSHNETKILVTDVVL